ncbi:MAG: sensor histidine kinase [Dehalococcoidales bacterium]|nr:sensor histidine kinase [Dehalococcoidales bacterium]
MIIALVIIITIIYYTIQVFQPLAFEILPITQSFVIWEFLNNFTGSLFIIPLLCSIALYWWRGMLIIWLLSIAVILPHILYYYHGLPMRIFNNIFYLSVPAFLVAYISLELKLREREKNISSEKEKERQIYLSQVFKAQEDERKRLAQEIHDDSIQRLTALAINANLLMNNKHLHDLPDIRNEIQSQREMVISVSQDLRRLSLDLRPTVLDDLGLVPAIYWLIDKFKQETGISAQIKISGDNPRVSKKYSVNIFRIVQEALNNVKRHSEATSVVVTLQFTDKKIILTIADNGKGFIIPKTSNELTNKAKLGIIGMRQRAQFLDAALIIKSEIGKGTTVILEAELYSNSPVAGSYVLDEMLS